MNIEQIALSLGASPIERARALMARLRDPDTGCPWDKVQTFDTIAPYTIEEAYEVDQAIRDNDMPALSEELGDLLLQVIFHAQIGKDNGSFDFDVICDGLVHKMIARHPHVFGDADERDGQEQTLAWEAIKDAERKEKLAQSDQDVSRLDGVALALPALMRAAKLQKRAARAGFDWEQARDVLVKINEESEEIIEVFETSGTQDRLEDEVGDLLFAAVNLSRKLKVDPEIALRRANEKFSKRFQYIETQAGSRLESFSLDELDALWNEAKQQGL